MPWRDELLEASFRGAPFFIRGHDSLEGGRRHANHEYPGRDENYAEDLGLVTGEVELDAYVIGDQYFAAKEDLIAACVEAGPAELVHPYQGVRLALCTACRVRETTEEGRMARFRLTFINAGENRYPTARTDTRSAVDGASDSAYEMLIEQFMDRFGL